MCFDKLGAVRVIQSSHDPKFYTCPRIWLAPEITVPQAWLHCGLATPRTSMACVGMRHTQHMPA